MKAVAVRNLRFLDAAAKAVDLEVQFDGSAEWVPFTYIPGDASPATLSITPLLTNVAYPPAAFVPPTVDELRAALPALTPRQFRAALILNGIDPANIGAMIYQIDDTTERSLALNEWSYASAFERSHPLVLRFAAAMNLTPEAVDAMWRQGLTI